MLIRDYKNLENLDIKKLLEKDKQDIMKLIQLIIDDFN